MDCAICFCPIEGTQIKCSDAFCATGICENCMVAYIGVEGTTLKCPREGCSGEYDEVSIASLTYEHKNRYRTWLIDTFKKRNKGIVDDHHKELNAVTILREERAKFYRDKMPKAVLKVSEIAFAGRLKKVRKIHVEIAKSKSARLCINMFCRGYIDVDMCCSFCNTTFCKQCEEPIVNGPEKHTCKKELLESVAYINSLTACPGCGTKVEKGEGCMAITCAVCNTDFWYNTGKKGEAGNHGQSQKVRLVESRNLSAEHTVLLKELGVLDQIQDLERKFGNQERLVGLDSLGSLVREVLHKEIQYDNRSRERFSHHYSTFIRHQTTVSVLSKKLVTIEKLLNERPDGFQEKICNVLVYGKKQIMVSEIEVRKPFIIVFDIHICDSISSVVRLTKLRMCDVVRALNSKDGIVKTWQIEYK